MAGAVQCKRAGTVQCPTAGAVLVLDILRIITDGGKHACTHTCNALMEVFLADKVVVYAIHFPISGLARGVADTECQPCCIRA